MRLARPPALNLFGLDDLADVPLDTPQSWPLTPLDSWPPTLPPTPVDSISARQTETFVHSDALRLACPMFSMPGVAPSTEDAPWLWQLPLPPPPPAGCSSTFHTCESVNVPLAAESASVLRLADTIPEPELGSVEIPTVGSMDHRLGTCKPCAFLHKQGCSNGVHCLFCHLCDPGEKRRRQKAKKAQLQSMKRELGTMVPIDAMQDIVRA